MREEDSSFTPKPLKPYPGEWPLPTPLPMAERNEILRSLREITLRLEDIQKRLDRIEKRLSIGLKE